MSENQSASAPSRRTPVVNTLSSARSGGAYIPPGRLRLMLAKQGEEGSDKEKQRFAWEALKKSINGLINRVNTSNVAIIVRELMRENLVRGRGLLVRALMNAQLFSLSYTPIYACVTAIINTKFPRVGELLLNRLVAQFKRAYKRNDKKSCLGSSKFIAHLVNQSVAHEIIALELATLLLENPTDDSLEIAVAFIKEVGAKLLAVSPKGCMAIFESMRSLVQEGGVHARTQYAVEVLFEIRKANFIAFPAVPEGLDCVNEEEQVTHMIMLDEDGNCDERLNVFQYDENYDENEKKYRKMVRDIVGAESDDSDASSAESGDEEDESEEDEEMEEDEDTEKETKIIDQTDTNRIGLRRTIYLTIQSSLDFEECAHKLLKLQLKGSQLEELTHMIVECCSQQRTYIKFYGLLAQRFCELDREIAQHFTVHFRTCYESVQRFETNKLRNVAKLFSHLLYTDSISWLGLSCIKLNEYDTCSASRVFIKILVQELSEYMGITKLRARIQDETLAEAFEGLFPRDQPQNTRFSINFFTSIGLGVLTEELREHLKNISKKSNE